MELYLQLEKAQRRTGFDSSSEMRFFLDHCGMLDELTYFAHYKKANKPFDIIRANIVIRAIMNKETIESEFANYNRSEKKKSLPLEDYMAEVVASLPYVEVDNEKVFIPILSRSINKIYSKDFEKLTQNPYKSMLKNYDAVIQDPFDAYGDELFNSFFTKLICVKKEKDSSAFYDFDSNRIYIINSQGRLDVQICLFDKGIRHRNTNHVIERIQDVVKKYYENDKEGFLKSLVDNQLISSSFLYKHRAEETRISKRIEKKI